MIENLLGILLVLGSIRGLAEDLPFSVTSFLPIMRTIGPEYVAENEDWLIVSCLLQISFILWATEVLHLKMGVH